VRAPRRAARVTPRVGFVRRLLSDSSEEKELRALLRQRDRERAAAARTWAEHARQQIARSG